MRNQTECVPKGRENWRPGTPGFEVVLTDLSPEALVTFGADHLERTRSCFEMLSYMVPHAPFESRRARRPDQAETISRNIQAYTHLALRLVIERAASVDLKEPLFDWNTP